MSRKREARGIHGESDGLVTGVSFGGDRGDSPEALPSTVHKASGVVVQLAGPDWHASEAGRGTSCYLADVMNGVRYHS